MPEPSVSSIAIYQLRVVLCGVSPLVWRRLLVVSTTSIAELHEVLDSVGNGHAIGDLADLHECVRLLVEAYQDFQPDRFDWGALNRRLRTLTQDREVRR